MYSPVSLRILVAAIVLNIHMLATADDGAIIRPNRDIQNKIENLTAALERAGEPGGEERAFKVALELDRAADKDKIELVRQLVLHHSKADDVTAGMTLSVAIRFTQVTPGAMTTAIAPLIGVAKDSQVQQALIEVAGIIENGDAERGFDFSHYRDYIQGKHSRMQDVDAGLVEHMFQRSPGQALQTFTMVAYQDERRKPLLWARHVVDDALWKRQYGFASPKEPDAAVTEQLERMATRDEYWARLYAAEVIRQHPEFGTEDLVTRLGKDSHPLVQKTANAIRPVIRQ